MNETATPLPAKQSPGLGGHWSTLTSKYSIYLVLVGMIFISSFLNPAFFSEANFSNVSRQISITTILAFGQTLLIICGMIDLAQGSVMALAGLLAVIFYKNTGLLVPSLFVGMLVGVLCNLASGLIVVRFNTPPFIATLAMQTAGRGLALLLTAGQNIYQLGNFVVWGQGVILGIPTPVIFLIGVTAFTWYLLNHWRLGRYIYAVGGNQEAARATGIQVKKTKLLAFAVNGVFVGLAELGVDGIQVEQVGRRLRNQADQAAGGGGRERGRVGPRFPGPRVPSLPAPGLRAPGPHRACGPLAGALDRPQQRGLA